jgi:hypothetical protein
MEAADHHFPTGNRCGHNPLAPRCFVPPPEHQTRPGILLRLSTRLRSYYKEPAAVLPSLNFANGSTRQQRSERREACLIVLDTLIHYLDLVTLTVGIPRAESIAGLTMGFIAERAGLSLNRVERAVKDLKLGGILSVHPFVTHAATGGLIGHGAIRAISPKLFTVFGLTSWLKLERKRAAKQRRQARLKAAQADLARRDLAMPDSHAGPAAAQAENGCYNRTREVLRLMEENPTAELQDLFDQVRRRYPTPSAHPA